MPNTQKRTEPVSRSVSLELVETIVFSRGDLGSTTSADILPPRVTHHPNVNAATAYVNWLRAAIASQPQRQPAPQVEERLLAVIRQRSSGGARLVPAWLSTALLIMGIFVFLWSLVRPGVALQWTSPTDEVTTFRVYRTPTGSEHFSVIGEVPARAGAEAYTFLDPYLLPGQAYQYRVEGVRPDGQIVHSSRVVERGVEVLPAQMALLIVSIILGMAVARLARSDGFTGHAAWPLTLRFS